MFTLSSTEAAKGMFYLDPSTHKKAVELAAALDESLNNRNIQVNPVAFMGHTSSRSAEFTNKMAEKTSRVLGAVPELLCY